MKAFAVLSLTVILVCQAAEPSSFSFLSNEFIDADIFENRGVAILWLPDLSVEYPPWLRNLRHSVKVWTSFGKPELRELQHQTEENSKMTVVVPHSSERQRRRLFEHLREHIASLALVRVVFVLRDEEELPYQDYPNVSCIAVALKQSGMDAPLDGYHNCSQRMTLSANHVSAPSRKPHWEVFNGRTLNLAVDFELIQIGITFFYTDYSESLALVSGLRACNATLLLHKYVERGTDYINMYFALREKMYDIWLARALVAEIESKLVYLGAVNSFTVFTFFSQKGVVLSPRVMESMAIQRRLLLALGLIVAMVMALYIVQGRLMKRRTNISRIAFFLVANIIGKGYALPASPEPVVRILCSFWMIGIISFSIYLQSAFTSEAVAPRLHRKLATVEDVEKMVEAGKILPCVVKHGPAQMILANATGILLRLRKILENCDDCLQDHTSCLTLASKGTHILLRENDPAYRPIPPKYNLAPAEDCFRTYVGATVTAKAFPFNQGLRHLVLRLIEAGANYFEERRLIRQHSYNRTDRPARPSINTQMNDPIVIYGFGIAIAVLSFMLEVVFAITQRQR